MTLVTTIGSIAERIHKNSYRNETDVREAIVNRVLYELGWDIYDPSAVRREYTVDKRRVDYALFTSTSAPAVFIEVKAPNSGDDGDRQLFEYAFHQGTPFAILVNGREWSFYLPAEQGNYSERRVQKLDLLERDPKDSARVLERYLSFDRVRGGSAHSDARADYQSAARQREAEKTIPRAWQDLISQPDELLIEPNRPGFAGGSNS
jgi:predicted type IV restriction endonuclease